MPNLLVKLRFQMCNNFKARDSTFINTILRTSEMLDNVGIPVPKKVLINTSVKMPVGFTNITSSTARILQINLYTTRDLRESETQSLGLNMLLNLKGEKITLTFKSLQYLFTIEEFSV